MKIDDGSAAEVVALENNNQALTVTVEVTWPDGSTAQGYVTFSAVMNVSSGPILQSIKSMGGAASAPPLPPIKPSPPVKP